jgi:UDP-N-acetyl-D-mannosaminuronic acid dehydrogenase
MKRHTYDVCIVGGLGHVGLPLGISLAQSGKKIVLYDVNQEAIDIVSRVKMLFVEAGAEELLGMFCGKTSLSLLTIQFSISNQIPSVL